MPELPEVEAVCRLLRKAVTGATIVSARILRPRIVAPQSATGIERRLRSRKIESVSRRAKNILIYLSGGMVLRVHLRMTGDLYVAPDPRLLPAAARACFTLDDERTVIFKDARALGRISLLTAKQANDLESSLGLEPLSREFTVDWLIAAAASSRLPAKLFLMDQSRIAGLGNIYAAEALFQARVHPAREVRSLSKPAVRRLHVSIREVLEAAVKSAYLEYSSPGPVPESELFAVAVYRREDQPCLRCGRRIRRIPQGGRSTYFCPGCQR